MNRADPTQPSPEMVNRISRLVESIINSYQDEPVDLLNTGGGTGERDYLLLLKPTYERTLLDIVSALGDRPASSVHVLEIGVFLGVVSIALARLGFHVTATDIPEFASCQRLKKRLAEAGVRLFSCNLRDYRLPFNDGEFDVVITCETLEHLNFNPLPVFKEINRVGKPECLVYLSTPNMASLPSRLKLWQGQSVHNPIKHFFAQLDPKDNMIVGLHWREYTGNELREMMEAMGFAVAAQRCDPDSWVLQRGRNPLRRMGRAAAHWILNRSLVKRAVLGCYFDPTGPDMGSTLVTLCRKARSCETQFHFTDATTPH
jgi:2-polyprenyl-3-methyl-5-hydroxy-6-metoxy-1,4-benzoquinol methylase